MIEAHQEKSDVHPNGRARHIRADRGDRQYANRTVRSHIFAKLNRVNRAKFVEHIVSIRIELIRSIKSSIAQFCHHEQPLRYHTLRSHSFTTEDGTTSYALHDQQGLRHRRRNTSGSQSSAPSSGRRCRQRRCESVVHQQGRRRRGIRPVGEALSDTGGPGCHRDPGHSRRERRTAVDSVTESAAPRRDAGFPKCRASRCESRWEGNYPGVLGGHSQ